MKSRRKSTAQPPQPAPAPEPVGGLGSIDWWFAQNILAPLRDDETCEVRGDVMRELLAAYAEHALPRTEVARVA